MSLLSGGNDTVVVYPEVVTTDVDGNTITKAATTGISVRAAVQPMPIYVGAESQNVGFETESKYRLRLAGHIELLGAQSQVEWQGKRYHIDGEPRQYNGSRRTAHTDYVMVRR